MAAILAMTAPAAMADELDDSHLALSGRDSYWHCLAIVDAIPGRRRRRPHDHGQQGHRAGASGYRERIHQAQGGGEIAISRGAAAGMIVWGRQGNQGVSR